MRQKTLWDCSIVNSRVIALPRRAVAFGAGGHGAYCICAAGVEVQEPFGLLQGGGGGVLGVHEGLGDFGEGQVFVRWQEVFHSRDEGVEVGA